MGPLPPEWFWVELRGPNRRRSQRRTEGKGTVFVRKVYKAKEESVELMKPLEPNNLNIWINMLYIVLLYSTVPISAQRLALAHSLSRA